MASRNDITGDFIKTKVGISDEFEENFTKIFGDKKKTNGGWIPPAPADFETDEDEELDEFLEDLDEEEDSE